MKRPIDPLRLGALLLLIPWILFISGWGLILALVILTQ